ncbi:hypothetical protein D8B26_007489 [Coccidioides posadasii str. Silveira]|uniref:ZIP Zinc transporter family protein n=1 Tax=Coccidioides posadasii (strain C735) TaxID=222929 RepID=C5PCV5_COCP7|nr:ZIP Zinc transporter family protein [Coccidioides posadasii C735 delta SOWgp]EER24916.1 ZIP Zinc transporter family protein [Coccidioides posadasii C735 delta SOWgp]QVM12872.1 hypothetical protein D8B26_007489 [Coccidioides posadasii str. Silveira]|eukprot:XP_003067061.1 ZIP Zinc transporter family protein [Coccidioides posadasii C735 delta SOWgp]
MEDMSRPQCGGAKGNDAEYDLPLHVAALFLVLAFSTMGAGFPVVAKKIPRLQIPPNAFFFCKHFGTGVLIATAFVHLLPTAFTSLNDPCLPPLFTEQYPAMPGVIMLGSLFALFALEMYLNAKTGGHSHGGATGESINRPHQHHHNAQTRNNEISWPKENKVMSDASSDDWYEEKAAYKVYSGANRFEDSYLSEPSSMPTWFMVFYEQYVREREWTQAMLRTAARRDDDMQTIELKQTAPVQSDIPRDLEVGEVDPAVLRKMSLNITILEGGILFHSVFVGMTVSIETEGFMVLLVAILFHQAFEGLGLGSRIAAVPYPKGSMRPWLLVLAFGTTAPIGQAIGLIARNTYDAESAFGLIMVGTFNAISSGLLIYAALVDLLAEDFLSEEAQHLTKKQKISGFIYVLMGGKLNETLPLHLSGGVLTPLSTKRPECPSSAHLPKQVLTQNERRASTPHMGFVSGGVEPNVSRPPQDPAGTGKY